MAKVLFALVDLLTDHHGYRLYQCLDLLLDLFGALSAYLCELIALCLPVEILLG